MSLSDDQRKAQPLLEAQNIILLPEKINYDAYREMMWALQYASTANVDLPIQLYCNGAGGDFDHTMAIVDLIKRMWVKGVLLGEAASAHSIIWAACHERIVYPRARIAIHNGAYIFQNSAVKDGWVRFEAKEIISDGLRRQRDDRGVAQIYADASNKDAKWWLKRMAEGGAGLLRMDAETLVNELQMAKWPV